MRDIVPFGSALSTELQRLDGASREQIRKSFRASNTREAYESAWKLFQQWCAEHRRDALPAEPTTVRLYSQFCFSGRRAAYEAALERCNNDPKHPDLKNVPKQNLTPDSIGLHLSAINLFHRIAGSPRPGESDEVQMAWETIRREKGRSGAPRGRGKKRAIEAKDLRPLLKAIGGNDPIDVRDRALIVNGFLSGRRRSEIAGMTIGTTELIEDGEHDEQGIVYRVGMLEFDDNGAPVRVERTKTNQYGDTIERIFIPRGDDANVDPVQLLRSWLDRRNPSNEWIWQSCSDRNAHAPLDPENIRLIIRRRVLDALIGWLDEHKREDPFVAHLRAKSGRFVRSRFKSPVIKELVKHYHLPVTLDPLAFGAHSLRAGFVTTARKLGKPDPMIMEQTGHRTSRMLDEYTHAKGSMKESAARGML